MMHMLLFISLIKGFVVICLMLIALPLVMVALFEDFLIYFFGSIGLFLISSHLINSYKRGSYFYVAED